EPQVVKNPRPKLPRAKPEISVCVAEFEGNAENRNDEDARRNGRPFEVLHLPGLLVRQRRSGHVEARKAAYSTDDKIGQAYNVPAATQTQREAEHGWGHAKRNDIRERIQVRAENRLPCGALARDIAIQDIAAQ